MNLQIKGIGNRKELKDFVTFPWIIYRDDPFWVPPIISDRMKFLDKNKGAYFTLGEAEHFMAFDGDHPVGRISAHINSQYEKYHDRETGFFGFFESINNPLVARALLEGAETWLRGKGKTRILGPMNFTIYDDSGMLYEGFDSLPVVLLAYNPSYYNDLLVDAGYKKAIDWYAFMVDKQAPIDAKLYKIRDRVLRQKDLKIITADMKKLKEQAQYVGQIFNEAWMENWGHVPLTNEQLDHFVEELKLVIVPELTYLAFIKDKCVGMSLTLKDANPAVKKANGRLFPFGLFKIMREMKKIKRLRTIAMGVLKEYRHRGIDLAFYLNTIEQGTKMGFTESECSTIVETNTRMIGALEDLYARKYKTYRFYEKSI